MSNNGIPALNDWQADNYAVIYDESAAQLQYVKTGTKVDITSTGSVDSVVAGAGITVDSSDAANPIVTANGNIVANRQVASYQLVLTDVNKLVEMNVGSANNLTVPANATVAFPTGTSILISQYGAGQTTVVAAGGVTIRSAGGALNLASQYSGATLYKVGTDEWYLWGDISV